MKIEVQKTYCGIVCGDPVKVRFVKEFNTPGFSHVVIAAMGNEPFRKIGWLKCDVTPSIKTAEFFIKKHFLGIK